jgi:hypothetical protein
MKDCEKKDCRHRDLRFSVQGAYFYCLLTGQKMKGCYKRPHECGNYEPKIVCATEAGPPPKDWKPEGGAE